MKTLLLTLLAVATISPATAAEPDTRLFELRTYHAAPGKLDALLTRFRDHTVGLFEKHGMTNIGYWLPVENDDNLLIYLLAYPDRETREASWKAFLADTDWKAAHRASEADGTLVDHIDSVFLKPTDYSPGFDDGGADPRLFEMRTYTTPEGLLPDLHSRFRDHTVGLFKKHGITNLGYFQPTERKDNADTTLLYFLAHENKEAAEASFEAFRNDPDWTAARTASEEKAGGSLTVPNGVKSLYLEPTDFSPLK